MPSSQAVDTDGDGLTDEFERLVGLDPNSIDTDRDGLTDGFEVTTTHTNALLADTDADGYSDGAEYAAGTDPGTGGPTMPATPDASAAAPTTQGAPTATAGASAAAGGTTDQTGGTPAPSSEPVIGAPTGSTPTGEQTGGEQAPIGGGSATQGSAGTGDATGGTTGGTAATGTGQADQSSTGTAPGSGAAGGTAADGTAAGSTGAGGTAASAEVTAGDPVATTPAPVDTDGDGLSDQYEIDHGMDPALVDSDGDGLADSIEVTLQTNGASADTDGDGVTDGAELRMGTDPLKADQPAGTPDPEPKVPSDPAAPEQPGQGSLPQQELPQQELPQQQVPQQPVQQQPVQQMPQQQLPQQQMPQQQLPQQQMPQQQVPQQPVVAQQLPTPAAGTTVTTVTTQTTASGTVTTVSTSTAVGNPGAGTAAVPAPTTSTTTTPTTPAADPAAAPAPTGDVAQAKAINQKFLDSAQAQLGDTYVFGAEVDVNNPDPSVFDCAELTKWAAHQAGVDIPGSSFEQYLDLKEKGLLIPIEDAKHIPGALIFHFSSEPTPGGGRPGEAHVAISRGDGTTIEAQSENTGVVNDDIGDRFEYAAVLPGTMPAVTGGDVAVPDTSGSGVGADGKLDPNTLTVDDVMHGIMMQESHGDYKAENPTSTASGAYQYIDGTWDGYGGYSHAADAPPEVQDEKMRADTQAAYDRLGDWERVIASHFAGENVQAGPKSDWDVHPGYDYNQNPSIRDYVDGVEKYIAEAKGVQLKSMDGAGVAADGTVDNGPDTADDLADAAASAENQGGAGHPGTADDFGIDPGAAVTGGMGLDSDGDGLTDEFERLSGTNAAHWDSDNDGLSDGWERAYGTNPLDADSDNDGLTDSFEVQHGSNPLASSLGAATSPTDFDADGGHDLPDLHAGADSGLH